MEKKSQTLAEWQKEMADKIRGLKPPKSKYMIHRSHTHYRGKKKAR